jgi:serine/threonine protein kinase
MCIVCFLDDVQACQSKNLKVTFLEILLFAEQTASALEYVVSKGFVHMDVAARNALLHTNNLVKLSDFGIVRDSRCCHCAQMCVCV